MTLATFIHSVISQPEYMYFFMPQLFFYRETFVQEQHSGLLASADTNLYENVHIWMMYVAVIWSLKCKTSMSTSAAKPDFDMQLPSLDNLIAGMMELCKMWIYLCFNHIYIMVLSVCDILKQNLYSIYFICVIVLFSYVVSIDAIIFTAIFFIIISRLD